MSMLFDMKLKSQISIIFFFSTTAEAKFQCKQCDKAFKTRFQLTRHVRLTHKESPTQCLHCGQTFKSIVSLFVKFPFILYLDY